MIEHILSHLHYNTHIQYTATHCNTPRHTATHIFYHTCAAMHRVSCDFKRILHVSSSCTKSFTCIRRSPSADCAAVKSDVTFSASARRRVTSSPCARCPSVRFVSNSVCCSVLQCVAVFLRVLPWVAVGCRVLPCVAVCGRV